MKNKKYQKLKNKHKKLKLKLKSVANSSFTNDLATVQNYRKLLETHIFLSNQYSMLERDITKLKKILKDVSFNVPGGMDMDTLSLLMKCKRIIDKIEFKNDPNFQD